jgi:hypothetical protein
LNRTDLKVFNRKIVESGTPDILADKDNKIRDPGIKRGMRSRLLLIFGQAVNRHDRPLSTAA